jgi:hypothetical protein
MLRYVLQVAHSSLHGVVEFLILLIILLSRFSAMYLFLRQFQAEYARPGI